MVSVAYYPSPLSKNEKKKSPTVPKITGIIPSNGVKNMY
jgi:hypothetical protein